MWVRLGCGQLQVRQARVVSHRWAGPMLWKVNVLKSRLLVLAISVVSLLPVFMYYSYTDLASLVTLHSRGHCIKAI